MTKRISKLVLTSHVTFSIGWLGAVAVFLALTITGLNSQNEQLVRACLLAMKISAWFVILPILPDSFGYRHRRGGVDKVGNPLYRKRATVSK